MRPKPLSLQLIVALGDSYAGPSDLDLYTHHTPAAMTSPAIDGPLGLPSSMSTGKPRVLYSLRRKRVLKPDRTYRRQKVADGDVLLLTDAQPELIAPLAEVVLAQTGAVVEGPPATGIVSRTRSLLVHPLGSKIVGGIIVGIVLALIFGR